MPLTMKQILNGIIQEETQMKLAAVEKRYAEFPEALDMLDEALDLIKEAEDAGEIPPLDASQATSVAVELVESEIQAGLWKEAGETVAQLLDELGITQEMIKEAAEDPDELDALARIAARAYASFQTGEDYLGLSDEGGEGEGEGEGGEEE